MNRFVLLTLAFSICSASAEDSRLPIVRDFSQHQQLLVDDWAIASKQNVRRVLGQPEKHGVVIEPTEPWEFGPHKAPDGRRLTGAFGCFHSTEFDPEMGRFRIWYQTVNGMAYAESEDGLTFVKPDVSRENPAGYFQPGRTNAEKHNLLFLNNHFAVMRNEQPGHSPEHRYLGAFPVRGEVKAGLAVSTDGLTWRPLSDGKPVTGRAADTQNQLLWDPIAERFRLWTREDLGGGGGATENRATRVMVHADNNLVGNATAWETAAKIAVNDPEGVLIPNSGGTPRRQIYSMTDWIHEGVYFGLVNIYEAHFWELFDGHDYETRHEDDVNDFYLAVSRTGAAYNLSWVYDRQPIISRGAAGEFDKDGIWPPVRPITHDGKHWFYYGGMNERHYSRGVDLRIGLATLPLNRIAGLRADDEPGVITTHAFELQTPKIAINADASGGRILTEILDGESKAIPGFSKDDAIALRDVDELNLEAKWREKPLAELVGQSIRLRFHLESATLFAFNAGRP